MTDIQKRTMIKMAALTAIAAAALVGCGKKEEAKPAAAPAAAPVVAKAAPLKIAFAYVGPTGDGGWTFAHDQARKALEKEFGDKIVTSFVEKVPESADAERVFRDLAGQGNKLIFGTTFGYMEPMLKLAPEFKDVKFEHATGYKQADNMRTYDSLPAACLIFFRLFSYAVSCSRSCSSWPASSPFAFCNSRANLAAVSRLPIFR